MNSHQKKFFTVVWLTFSSCISYGLIAGGYVNFQQPAETIILAIAIALTGLVLCFWVKKNEKTVTRLMRTE